MKRQIHAVQNFNNNFLLKEIHKLKGIQMQIHSQLNELVRSLSAKKDRQLFPG